MSGRERRLAGGVGLAAIVGLVYVILIQALGYLGALDEKIRAIEEDLLDAGHNAARSETMDALFSEIAAQHSSDWTQEEVHDRLRQEIYRLAQQIPPPPGSTAPAGPALVQIPSLPQGRLEDSGAGYREYKIAFSIQPADIGSILQFLARLQQSPQVLRMDGLELTRLPETGILTAAIEVTRTVVDSPSTEPAQPAPSVGAGQGGNLARNPSFEQWDAPQGRFPEWNGHGVGLAQSDELASDGAACLSAHALSAAAAIYQRHELSAGATYDLTLDAAASGPATLGIMREGQNLVFEGARKLASSGSMYRYELSFTVPDDGPAAPILYVPYLTLEQPNSRVYLDNVVLGKRAE
jgi:hypothetical protein